MSTHDEIIKEIEAFLKETGMTPTTFGQKATKDRALMTTLRKGRVLKVTTLDRIRDYIFRERAKRGISKRLKGARDQMVTA